MDIVPNTPMHLCDLFCQPDDNAPLTLGGDTFHSFYIDAYSHIALGHSTICRYYRLPRRSPFSHPADYVRPAELAYRVPLCLTPTLPHAAIFYHYYYYNYIFIVITFSN